MTSVARECCIEGCERVVKSRKMCNAHYQRHLSGADLLNPPIRVYRPRMSPDNANTPCFIQGCLRARISSVPACKTHYATCYRFNISILQLDLLLSRGCQVCGRPDNLHVDHDHSCCPGAGLSCGECIRGALCSNCNTGLGLFRDNPEVLGRAIEYLRHGRVY